MYPVLKKSVSEGLLQLVLLPVVVVVSLIVLCRRRCRRRRQVLLGLDCDRLSPYSPIFVFLSPFPRQSVTGSQAMGGIEAL